MHNQKNKKHLGLYLHVPFCEKKCYYCSFAMTVSQRNIPSYLECLLKEMESCRGQRIHSVYMGGGTPSILSENQIAYCVQSIRKNFIISSDAEFTCEMNPEHVSVSKVRILKALGVNRFSLGVQTFNDVQLKALGRNHSRETILHAFKVFEEERCANVSIDLIYGLPHQSMPDLLGDLDQIKAWDGAHVSLYALSVEKNSLFDVKNVQLQDTNIQVKQFVMVKDFLESCGYYHYEVSNFAKPGKSSIHNTHYWQGGDYIGLGASAHSHLQGHRYWNVSSVSKYIEKMRDVQSALEAEEYLALEERLMESVLFGLRMRNGVCVHALEKRMGCLLPEEKKHLIDRLIEEGLLLKDQNRLKATLQGMLVLDEISARLI